MASAISSPACLAAQPQPASPPEADAGYLDVTVEEAFAGTKRRVMLNEHGRPRQVDVQIPAGVTEGQSLRIAGGGGGASLIFRSRLRPHHLYAVSGRDVQVELPLAPWEAAFGREGRGSDPRRDRGADGAGGSTSRARSCDCRGTAGIPAGDQIVIIKLVTPTAQLRRRRKPTSA